MFKTVKERFVHNPIYAKIFYVRWCRDDRW